MKIKRFSTWDDIKTVSSHTAIGAGTGALLGGAIPVAAGNFGKGALIGAGIGGIIGGIGGLKSGLRHVKDTKASEKTIHVVVDEPGTKKELLQKYPELREAEIFMDLGVEKKLSGISMILDNYRIIPDWNLYSEIKPSGNDYLGTKFLRSKTGWDDLIAIHGDNLAFSTANREFYYVDVYSKKRKKITIPGYKKSLIADLQVSIRDSAETPEQRKIGERCLRELRQTIRG